MRTDRRFLLACLLPCFLVYGCEQPDLRKGIIGQWDCTNLNWNTTRAVNDAAKFTMVFSEDGTCVSYWTDTGGSRYMESTNKFSCAGGRVNLDAENVGFRAKLSANELTLIRENTTNAEKHGSPDDAGKRIIFRRAESSSIESVRP